MPIMCGICRDYVTERPQALSPNEELVISALGCGHVFHLVCVRQWFHCTAEIMHPNRTDLLEENADKGKCPVCKKPSLLSKSLRIFPTGDQDCDSVVELKKDLATVSDQNMHLSMELYSVINENKRLVADLAEMRGENHRLHVKLIEARKDFRNVSSEYIAVAKKLCDSLEARHLRRPSACEVYKVNGRKDDFGSC